jgi:hypothetical protein
MYVLPGVWYHICILVSLWHVLNLCTKCFQVSICVIPSLHNSGNAVLLCSCFNNYRSLFSNGWRPHTSRCITCDRHASVMKTICFFEHTCMLPFINIQYGEKKVWYIIVHASTILRWYFQMQLYGRTKSQHCNMTQCWSMDCSARSMMETSIDWK